MTPVQFTYATRQGKPVVMQMLAEDRFDFELTCTNSITKKYGDTITAPRVHVVVSENPGNVLTCVLLADRVLKFE